MKLLNRPHLHHARCNPSERGTSFAELMLATLIVGTTIVASITSLSGSAKVYHFFADGPHEALMLAQEIHEAASLLPWEADPGADPNFGPYVTTFWDMDEMDWNPPRSAEYEVVASHLQWTQQVVIKTVDIDDPSTEVDPETFSGGTLTKLEVTVKNGEAVVGVFPWWMTQPDSDS